MVEVRISIPDRLADELGREALPRTLLEALAIEAYRRERFTAGEIGDLLGFGFAETEAFLKERGVPLLYDADDIEADRRANSGLIARRLFPIPARSTIW